MSEGRAHHDTLQRGSLVRRVLPAASVTRVVPAGLRVAVLAALAALAIGLVPAACEAGNGDAVPCCPDPARFWLRCSLESRTPDSVRLRLRDTVRTFPLGTVELQNAAAALRQKNRALASFAAPPSSGKLEALAVEVHWSIRLAVILGAVAILLPLARTYRKSDVQERAPAGLMLAWFVVLAAAYVCTVVLRWWAGGLAYTGGVQVPANPVVLAGLSALTFGGARASRIWKERRLGPGAPDPAADVASMLMFVVHTIAIVIYVVKTFAFLGRIELACSVSLPGIEGTILGVVATAHGAYLMTEILPLLRARRASG